jgi:glycosyltransferase involved in cell wall biosynthesis
MRIAFVTHSRRKIGGAETYLDTVICPIAAEHEVALLYESDWPERDLISVPKDAPLWNTAQLGRNHALQQLREWGPDVCFVQGLDDVELEAEIVAIGNAVLYVHNYYGSCVSGNKMIYNGAPKACERAFGPACLLHYFPDRCGGRNPITMWQRYRVQSRRLELMREYRALLANSEHMRRELARYELTSEVAYPFAKSAVSDARHDLNQNPLQLTFSGRMQTLKGGQLLIDAAPEVQRRLGRKLQVTFIGDGPDRSTWEKKAHALANDSLSFKFMGWLSSETINRELSGSHLLVMPSIWPEPFGLVGLETGLHGLPAVAFAVGGIPEWLHDGINGHLASSPSTPANLAEAIVRSLSDVEHYQRLCKGAREEALKYDLRHHIDQLLSIFSRCSA